MSSLLPPDRVTEWLGRIAASDGATADAPAFERTPLHVVYGGAHRFTADVSKKLGRIALDSLTVYAPDAATFASAIGIEPPHADSVYERVVNKLKAEPIEDYRVDFEDGYGARADDEEDRHAHATGVELAKGVDNGTLPPSIGIRIKRLGSATAARGLRTLERVLGAYDTAAPPSRFVVTLPKVSRLTEVAVAAEALSAIEAAHGWPEATVGLEVMIEDPRLWFDDTGAFALLRLGEASAGRLTAVHLGPYDYTASVGVAGAAQSLFHPVLDVARHLMQIAFVGSAVRLGDGPTMLMPIPPHRGSALTETQQQQNRTTMHRAWRSHADAVRASRQRGFDLGWDLHPAQIPARLGAVYADYISELPDVATRLTNFVDAAGRATRVGAVFDDAATGQGLVNFCLRAMATGAVTEAEVIEATGLNHALLSTRSFDAIVRGSATPAT